LRLDTILRPDGDPAADARRLADLGFDGAFTFEGPNDVFFPLVRAAGAAPIDLWTNVAIAFPRSPAHLAQAANDLQTLTGGRFQLGLGSQVRAQVVRRFGAAFDHPAARMKELIAAVGAVFASWETGDRLDFHGDFYELTLMTPMFNPGPNPFGRPPILLGALGPRMVRVAAEVADGLLVMPFNSEGHVREKTLPIFLDGLAAAGRARTDVEVTCEVIVATGRNETEQAAADAGTRGLLSFYGSTPAYRPVLDHEGWGEAHEELHALSRQGRWAEMGNLIDDDMLTTLAVRGTPAECAAEIRRRYGDLADRIAFYLPYDVAPDGVAELVDRLKDPDPR
jgi:probable F420-dependent oxidoreductase